MKVANLYNTLQSYHQFTKKNGEATAYAIHKKFSAVAPFQNVNEWLVQNFDFNEFQKVLDVGCGVGATAFAIANESNSEIEACTLSERECEQAKAIQEANNISNCQFFLHDFSQAFDKQYDFILAIESLKHAENLDATLQNLQRALKPNGKILIVEDVAVQALSQDSAVKIFQEAWCLTQLYSLENYQNGLKGLSLKVFDFTPFIRIPKAWILSIKKQLFTILYRLLPSSKIKQVVLIFLGGFILDDFYAKNKMQYKAMLFTNTER